jgi:hypothetical protein
VSDVQVLYLRLFLRLTSRIDLQTLIRISAAVVWFRPVFALYFSNLKRNHGSGSTIFPNLGPDHPERFTVVGFWFRTGSDLQTSQIHLFIF